MTNYDRAVQVIYDEATQTWERGEILTAAGEAERLANALADAGLLAPDLPEKDLVTQKGTHVWMPKQGFTVTAYHDGEVRMGIPPAYPDTALREVIYTQPLAIEQALALLAAAAQYAKEKA